MDHASSLEHDCPIKQRAFNFDDRGISRVAEVNDLLRDMQDPETRAYERDIRPQLTINLTLINLVKRAETADPFIIIRPGAVTDNSGGRVCLYRIGTQARPAGKQQSVKVSGAWFWYCDLRDNPTGVRLVEAHSWSVRDLEICSPGEGRICGDNLVRLEEANVEGRRQQPNSAKSSKAMNCNHMSKAASYFKVSPVTVFPDQDITVAVRYISHLTGKEAEAFKSPLGKEFWCDENDDFTSLCAALGRSLRKEKANAALFQPPLKELWRFEIWVMLQVSKGRSLFRFENEAKLMHWLHEPYVAKGDTVLFAEVYLCPINQKKIITKSGRTVKKE
ncbi:hypothetical protein Q7P35_002978 [Cladosporium inversicolor]